MRCELAAGQHERPLWSADGSTILFARFDENDRASLWMVSARRRPSLVAAFWEQAELFE